jgi:competence CoiA-like predicted nuclease
MLIAKHKITGERIVAARHESAHELRSKYSFGDLVCLHCEGVMFPRSREGFVLHFVHRGTCESPVDRHPESLEHEEGKFVLAKYLQERIKEDENPIAKIEVEHPLPECGENGRIADVALVYDNGNLVVCECQLARITPHELEQRTRDYLSIGADVLWFLGGEADTSENRAWLRSVFGSVGRIEFNYGTERDVFVYQSTT